MFITGNTTASSLRNLNYFCFPALSSSNIFWNSVDFNRILSASMSEIQLRKGKKSCLEGWSRRRPFDSSLLGHLSLEISGSHNSFLCWFEWECPPRPISLSTWVPVGRTVWGRLGDVALLAEEVCRCGQALKFQKTHTIPSQSLCLWLAQDVSSQPLLQHLPAAYCQARHYGSHEF